jgi:uncharacterized Tic20 family protein
MSTPAGQAEPTPEDRQMAMIAHISGCFVWLLGPILVYVLKGNTSPYVKYHATQAILYHLVAGILMNLIAAFTFGIGCPLIVVFWAVAFWVGLSKANKGLWDGYPGVTGVGMPTA